MLGLKTKRPVTLRQYAAKSVAVASLEVSSFRQSLTNRLVAKPSRMD